MPEFEVQVLVHALDKAQKRRFNELNKVQSHATDLFSDLNQNEKISESSFKKKYADRSYMGNYSYNKGYLYDLILDAIRSLRKMGGHAKPVHQSLPEMIADAEFLHEKMLYQQCAKRLDKARKEAEKYELYEDLLKILRFQGRLMIERQEKGYADKLEVIFRKMEETTTILHNKYQVLALRNRIFIQARQAGALRGEDRRLALEQLFESPLLSDPKSALCFDAKLNLHFARALYHQLTHKLDLAWREQKQIFNLWKRQPQFKEIRPTDYGRFLNNYLQLSLSSRQLADFVPALHELENMKHRSKDETAEARVNGLYARLHFFMGDCNWEDAALVEQTFQKELENFAEKLLPSRQMAFYLSFARLNLISEALPKAIRWNNRVLDMRDRPSRRDLWLHALTFSLILHFEAQDMDKLQNSYRAALRAYSKENLELKFERLILSFLRKLPDLTDPAELRLAFQDLRGQLHALQSEAVELQAEGYQFILNWLDSKIQGKPLKMVLEEQLKS